MFQSPSFTQDEAVTRSTFLAMLWSMSYPGRVHDLPQDVDAYPAQFLAIASTLLDLETTFYTPDSALKTEIARTGAREASIDTAAYLFFPDSSVLTPDMLRQVSEGTMQFPDTAGTLIIGCQLGSGQPLTFTGPGIETENHLLVDGLPSWIWAERDQIIQYPLGWDLVLVDGNRCVSIPRTTRISVEEAS